MGNKGARYLASLLKNTNQLPSLAELDLSANEITSSAAIELAEAVKQRKQKQTIKLLLSRNKITESGLKKLTEILGNDVVVEVEDEDEEEVLYNNI